MGEEEKQKIKAIKSILAGKDTIYGQMIIDGGTITHRGSDVINLIGKHGGLDIQVKNNYIERLS